MSEAAHTQYWMSVDIGPRKVVIRHPKVPEAGDTEEVVCHLHQDVRPIGSADCVRAGVCVQDGRCHSGVQNDPCQSARAYQAFHCICSKISAFRPKQYLQCCDLYSMLVEAIMDGSKAADGAEANRSIGRAPSWKK